MKLLLSTRFHPAIGGLETVMEILAGEWIATGHEVRVVTDVPGLPSGEEGQFPYAVHHQPGARQLLELVRWCDVYVQGCIGLKTLWPLCIYRRLYLASHQTWYRYLDGRLGWQNHIKRWVSRHAINVAPSQAIAADLPGSCVVIPNPYRDKIFKRVPGTVRDRDLIFVGRLVSDKGTTLLLQAVAKLRARGQRPSVTIVGDGPERPALERQTADLALGEQVLFTGSKSPDQIAALLNRHRVLVVPSLWSEPFGVVALEGIACGCSVVGSEKGGLKDAIGPCGLTFPNGEVSALVGRLETLLQAGMEIANQETIDTHLAKHQSVTIAKNYIDAMLAALPR